jgi:L-threonylcarbamoyladenylate synthase
MLLYPTETIYALGVNALDAAAMQRLYTTKGRVPENPVSVLVRNATDIEQYAYINAAARMLIGALLPGPLTIVLSAKSHVPSYLQHHGMTSFRISPDPIAQQVIHDFMATHNAPLTCTSANQSGLDPAPEPAGICEQLSEKAANIAHIYDDGPRTGTPSTVVAISDAGWRIIREGSIPTTTINELLHTQQRNP